MTREGFETIRGNILLAAELAEYLDFQTTGESIPWLASTLMKYRSPMRGLEDAHRCCCERCLARSSITVSVGA